MVNPIRCLFPRRPALGIALLVALLVEGSAMADHLIITYVTSVQEGTWKLDSATPIYGQGGMSIKCVYSRSDDKWIGYSYATNHLDAWGEDSPGHHKSATHTFTGSVCGNPPPASMTDLSLYHRYAQSHTGTAGH